MKNLFLKFVLMLSLVAGVTLPTEAKAQVVIINGGYYYGGGYIIQQPQLRWVYGPVYVTEVCPRTGRLITTIQNRWYLSY